MAREMFLHCAHCLREIPPNLSPHEWNMTETSLLFLEDNDEKCILRITCRRCNMLVADIEADVPDPLREVPCGVCDGHCSHGDDEVPPETIH